MKDCCILLQSNDNYAPYMGVTLVSLYENNRHRREIDTFIIDDALSEENKEKAQALADKYRRKLEFISIQNIVEFIEKSNLPKLRDTSYTTYLKLFVIEQFKDRYERVLYLDSDLVIAKKLDVLFEMELGEFLCAMALDLEPEIRKALGIECPEKWFNAGVILFNTGRWCFEKCTGRVVEFIEHNRVKLYFHEQDIMNCLFRDRVKILDNKYNLFTVFKYLGIDASAYIYGWSDTLKEMEAKSFTDPYIYHCFPIMGRRPWHQGYAMDAETGWSRYLKMTPWSEYALQKRESSRITKVQVILHRMLPDKAYHYLYLRIYRYQVRHIYKQYEA